MLAVIQVFLSQWDGYLYLDIIKQCMHKCQSECKLNKHKGKLKLNDIIRRVCGVRSKCLVLRPTHKTSHYSWQTSYSSIQLSIGCPTCAILSKSEFSPINHTRLELEYTSEVASQSWACWNLPENSSVLKCTFYLHFLFGCNFTKE